MKYICTKQIDKPDGQTGVEEIFLFPKRLEFDVIAPLLNIIKNENWRNWHRVKREPISYGEYVNGVFTFSLSHSLLIKPRADIDSELYKKQFYYGCKYIVVAVDVDDSEVEGSNAIQEIYIFPKAVHHDCFYEAINNQDEYRALVSAGFVDSDLNCHGSSETLGVKSRPEDTKLLKKEMSM